VGVGVAAGFAVFFGAPGENYVGAGFFEDEVEDGEAAAVEGELDVVDPSISILVSGVREVKGDVTYHRQFMFRWIAPPMKGPRAIPTTEVIPKMDMGTLLALSPFQISVIVPPTILMDTEEAPPPKKRAMMSVAKLGAKAQGMSHIRNRMYDTCRSVRGSMVMGWRHLQSSRTYVPSSPS